MSSISVLVSQRNFSDKEFSSVVDFLKDKCEITVCSITKDEAIGMEGMRIRPEKTLREINPTDYDAFVIIGGSGSPKLMDYPEVMDRIKRFHEGDKIIGAICLAPMILARSGILKGVMATVFPVDYAITVLRDGGATYVKEHVVEDGNIITADGPKSAGEFTRRINERISLK